MRLFVQGAVLLLGMGFLSAPAKAQKVVIEDDVPNSIVLVSQDKAGDEIVRIMNETQSPRFHDPKSPRCLVRPTNFKNIVLVVASIWNWLRT